MKKKIVKTASQDAPDSTIPEGANRSIEPKTAIIEQFILEAGSDDLYTFGGRYQGGIFSQQVADEFAACINTLLESGEKIKSYLEIGVAAGGSAFIINHYFKPDVIVLVDDNMHPKSIFRKGILEGIEYKEIIGYSRDEAVISEVAKLSPYDLLMIDGDHSYEGIKEDVKNYGAMLRAGGFFIFHDSQVALPHGCARMFQDLKNDKQWELVDEFVSTKYPTCGTALFRKVGK